MPLLKRKPFVLAEPPKDLEPDELVHQVRFTKEIFRDYHDYLNRINLYRQRVWTCKVTGKTNMTYEEAMVSEKHATEKVQQIPKELMAPALRIIQYSMLQLKELADAIAEKLQDWVYVGAELHGKKDDGEHPCKILKVLEEGVDGHRYEVAWLDKNKSTIDKAEVSAKDLVQKKFPFSRNILKSFIRESTYRNAPWVIHDELAQNYGISTDIPEELKGRAFFSNGLLICKKKRKNEDVNGDSEDCKRKKSDHAKNDGSSSVKENGECEKDPIKYPIDDLLVKPSSKDPVFADRPSPSRDFNVPVHCVGDLLRVWDFCNSFGRLLHLSPYSLEDFENSVCHKESSVALLVESHSSLLRVLVDDGGDYASAVEKRRQRSCKITKINWQDYLCDFLEVINVRSLRKFEATIKRGHYGLVDIDAKLKILCELVNQVLETSVFREKLDEVVEQLNELYATRRGEALEDGRKRREEKERLKAVFESSGGMDEHCQTNGATVSRKNNHNGQDGNIEKKRSGENESYMNEDALGGSMDMHSNDTSKRSSKKLSLKLKESEENVNGPSRKESRKQLMVEKDPSEKNSVEQRREYYEREMEKIFVRTSPLGKDRHYNRYWWFRREGRIFVESSDSKDWGYYSSKEELDAFMKTLNCKGVRERALRKQLEKHYSRICSQLQKKEKEQMQKIAIDEAVLRRSTRVRAPPRENPANAFLKYVNKWKEE